MYLPDVLETAYWTPDTQEVLNDSSNALYKAPASDAFRM